MHYHHQNLTDGKLPLWRHGRAWYGPLNWEWSVLCNPWLGAYIEKGGYESNRISMSLGLILFRLYLGLSFPHSREFRARRLGASFEKPAGWGSFGLWVYFWHHEDSWDYGHGPEPRFFKLHMFHIAEWITGRPRYERVQTAEPFDVVVPLPEGCYRAVATPERLTWTYRFGYRRVWEGHELAISDGGLPFSGKGENSWDCGDDGLCGISAEGPVENVIGRAVVSVLKTRRRHGTASFLRGRDPVMARFPAGDNS